jgi:hypothetical protein
MFNRRTITSALLALTTALCAAAAAALPASAAATAKTAGPAAAPPAARELLGVSCVTANNCLAVGIDYNAFKKAGGPLAETWNGRSWRIVGVALPQGATAGILLGVSCVAAARCVAVGFYDKGSGRRFALADTWSGKTWTPAQPPAPGGPDTALDGVSCTSVSSCVAVGSYTKNTGRNSARAPLAETWSGRKWTEAGPPARRGGLSVSGLGAVSCESAARCVAVGAGMKSPVSGGVIESWNGKTWSITRGPALPGDIGAAQTGVSCPSAGSCVAVGFGTFAMATVSFSEIWKDNRWRVVTVPSPRRGTRGLLLSGVSCAAASQCVAVGAIESFLKGAGTARATAATWKGKAWTVTSVPGPGKGMASLFKDVTCLSAVDCVAVGQVSPAGSARGVGLSGFWNGKSWRLVAAN